MYMEKDDLDKCNRDVKNFRQLASDIFRLLDNFDPNEEPVNFADLSPVDRLFVAELDEFQVKMRKQMDKDLDLKAYMNDF